MADPHHIEELDSFDRLTVRAYRTGLFLSSAGLIACGIHLTIAGIAALFLLLPVIGCALAVANMHLYDRRVRWFIGVNGWIGLCLVATGASLAPPVAPWVTGAGLGFVFVALSGFALKEQFCFRIPGLRLVPLFLASATFLHVSPNPWTAGPPMILAGAVMLTLSIAKTRQPLHFDIGDKSRYQV